MASENKAERVERVSPCGHMNIVVDFAAGIGLATMRKVWPHGEWPVTLMVENQNGVLESCGVMVCSAN
jgi:hypothetical protein